MNRKTLRVGVALLLTMAGLAMMAPSASAHGVSPEIQILTTGQQELLGQGGWPDDNMGVERNGPNNYTFYAPSRQNGIVGIATGTLNNPIASGTVDGVIINGAAAAGFSYAGGGPVYKVPGTSTKIMFVHLEKHFPGADPWRGTIGLAKSVDNGASWTFQGEIFRHGTGTACDGIIGANGGGAPYIIRPEADGDYFWVYFRADQQWAATPGNCNSLSYRGMGVMKAKVADVVANPANVTVWKKYFNGAWTEPALGGRTQDIWPDPVYHSWDLEVKWSSYHQKYVLIGNRCVTVIQGLTHRSSLTILESANGLQWSTPLELVAVQDFGGCVQHYWHPFTVGLGTDPYDLGQQFYVYHLRHKGATTTSPVYRRTITLTP